MNNQLDFRTGIRDTIPTAFGYIGIGLAFGVVARGAGHGPIITLLMSLLAYSGTAQFIIVSMIAASSAYISILFAVLMVSARMILVSMTVAPYLRHESMWRNVWLGTLITDETFALTMSKLNYTDHKLNFDWLNAANIFAYSIWALSSVVGNLIGSLIPNPNAFGLDFALVAMFIGLLYLQVIGDRAMGLLLQGIVVILVCVLMYLGLIFIPSSVLVLVVTVVACLLGMGVKHAFF